MTQVFIIEKAQAPQQFTTRDNRTLTSSTVILRGADGRQSPRFKVEVFNDTDYTAKVGQVVAASLHFGVDEGEKNSWQRVYCYEMVEITKAF